MIEKFKIFKEHISIIVKSYLKSYNFKSLLSVEICWVFSHIKRKSYKFFSKRMKNNFIFFFIIIVQNIHEKSYTEYVLSKIGWQIF